MVKRTTQNLVTQEEGAGSRSHEVVDPVASGSSGAELSISDKEEEASRAREAKARMRGHEHGRDQVISPEQGGGLACPPHPLRKSPPRVQTSFHTGLSPCHYLS